MAYYLAAAVIFPREPEQFTHLHMHFTARKRFAVTMLWAAFLLETLAIGPVLLQQRRVDPSMFWGWLVPFFIAVNGSFVALFLVRGRRANIALLVVSIFLAIAPYWHEDAVARMAARLWSH